MSKKKKIKKKHQIIKSQEPDGTIIGQNFKMYEKKINGYRTENENEVFDIFHRFSDTYKNNKGTAVDLLSPKVEITGLLD